MAVKIKLESDLFDRVKKVSQVAGYASPEEFIVHMIEKELTNFEGAESEKEVEERLRGLGYIE